MIDITREIDRDLEVDVLALQALPTPSALFGSDLGALGGRTCFITVTCCVTCQNRTLCHDTIL